MDAFDWMNDPRALNIIGTSLNVGGNMVGGLSHIQFGQQAQAASQFQAAQLRQQENNVQGSAQRQAFNVDQQAQMVTSRAMALAAASGGGATDPTVVNNISRIAAEGAYRKAVSLYQGQDKARELEMQAQATEYEGEMTNANAKNVGRAQFMQAGSSLLRGMQKDSTLLKRFGAGGPNLTGAKPAAYDLGED